MRITWKLLSSVWLLFLAFAVQPGDAQTCRPYDEGAKIETAYDAFSASPLNNYDFGSAPSKKANANQATGPVGILANFAKLLAAERGLYSTTAGQGMESGLFSRIQSAFQRNGGVMQADAESTRFLLTRGAEGATIDSSTILLRE